MASTGVPVFMDVMMVEEKRSVKYLGGSGSMPHHNLAQNNRAQFSTDHDEMRSVKYLRERHSTSQHSIAQYSTAYQHRR